MLQAQAKFRREGWPAATKDLLEQTRPHIGASDASPDGGAFVRYDATAAQAKEIYRLREKRGGYSRLENPFRRAMREEGLLGSAGTADDEACFPHLASPERPLAFDYDYLDLHGGSAILSAKASRAGLRVGPPIEINHSRWFDLLDTRVLEWLVWIVMARRTKILTQAPPMHYLLYCKYDVAAALQSRA